MTRPLTADLIPDALPQDALRKDGTQINPDEHAGAGAKSDHPAPDGKNGFLETGPAAQHQRQGRGVGQHAQKPAEGKLAQQHAQQGEHGPEHGQQHEAGQHAQQDPLAGDTELEEQDLPVHPVAPDARITIAGLGHQDGIGAQTDTGPQPDEAVGQGTVVHHIGHPELAHAVAAGRPTGGSTWRRPTAG